ncbi:sensor histidine kinase [Bacteroides nordii]|uniref:sensor histidine kinase n=1 Tax=Bacteroides nordii TaxID=291645 RepID=UPI003562EC8D
MTQRFYNTLLFLLFTVFLPIAAAGQNYNVLFIQSYTNQTPWHSELTRGLRDGFGEEKLKVNIVTEYLDADYWAYRSEKLIMSRICERARKRGVDLIVTSSDEAFHTLFACGDSLPRQIPVVFYGIKYPDEALMTTLPNICGFTSNPDFFLLLEQANKVFPERKEVVCVNDNSFLSLKGKEDFMNEWGQFVKRHPDYKLQTYNVQTGTTNSIISSVCYPRNSHGRIVVVPKWSPFMAFIGKNSKAPFFSCQSLALTNGVFCAYDADPYASSRMAGVRAAKVLKGTSPADLGITESPIDFYYDYKQLDFFHVAKDRVKPGIILNEPHWEKYKFFFILLYASILGLLVFIVVWLIRANRREARRRMHAQTRLLVQNRLVAQRDEFDNIFHSIREGVITYDADFRIHFTNLSLLRMLHLPVDVTVRPYEGLPAGSIFKIYSNGKNVLHEMLKEVIKEGKSCIIPSNSFMQEVHSGNYFPISGEMVPIHSRGEITGVALSCHNVSDEEMRKRFFDLAIEDSSIYPWQFNIRTNIFTFPQGFLQQFGFDESVTTITREGMEEMVHPEELGHIRSLFDAALTGRNQNTRMSFRQRNADGHYEWWEYRTSVLSGLTSDEPYSILGVCQSIQRYKSTEEELTIARDKALQADKLKSAFLANMSHEIRTPLNAIVGFSDLLSDTSAFTEEEVSQFITTINKNCSLLLALINDILDLSRIESGTMDFQFARHSLPLLLKNVHDSQQLNMPPGVELKLDIPAGSKKYMVTDNVRLQQVVNNLINNAAKFTTSGSITVGYTEDEPGYTSLFVEDTGKGISQDGLDHIFERFYKVDNFTQGAGLGLSICQTIVMRLNGTICVTSEVGKGTRFTVRIPDVCE